MREIRDELLQHTSDVVREWERLVREYPWFSLPATHRLDNLPDVLVGLVGAALGDPPDPVVHRAMVDAASRHGEHRRAQGIPEHLIFTEYHLLRQAIWLQLVRGHPLSHAATEAMLRIDAAISLATNASMWGYHRAEIEGLGKWDEGMERIVASSPFLRRADAVRKGGTTERPTSW